jgi:hypothetical protein
VPDLRYCSAHGPTAEQALREVQTAMAAWLERARARGDPVSELRYRPAIYTAGRPSARGFNGGGHRLARGRLVKN